MGIKRIVDTDFWTDDKVVELFSPEDKYFMLYLMTNPHTTQLGIYSLNKKIMAFELGYSVEAISVLIDRFETKYNIIRFSKETNEIALKNSLRHSIVKGGKPVEDLLLKEIKKVKDKSLLKFVYDELIMHDNLNKTVEIIIDKIKNDIDNDNDNDNDNDVSYHDSSTNRQRKRFVPPTLEEVQAYCLERKNNVDAKKFYDYYTASNWYDGKGNKVKSWKQKVITWERDDKQSKKSTDKGETNNGLPEPKYRGVVCL